jgi:hypothetical protein
MFSLLRGKRGDEFDQRKRRLEVCRRLRRIVDATAPNTIPEDQDDRRYKRYSRTVPVLIASWREGKPCPEQTWLGLTKDFSDLGLSVLLPDALVTEEVICALRLDQPLFARGKVAWQTVFGAGFWQVGIHLSELVSEGRIVTPLLPLTEQLCPAPVVGRLRQLTTKRMSNLEADDPAAEATSCGG